MTDPASFLPLSPAEFQILLVLKEQPRHGYAIMQEVERRAGTWSVLGPGTLYGALKRLREGGLLVEDVKASEGRRIAYRLTALGLGVCAAEAERYRALVRWADTAGA